MFLVIKTRYPIHVFKKYFEKKDIDLLLIGEENKKHYVVVKDFNTFMYNHTLHRGRKHFCCYCLRAFSTENALTCHVKDCLKINGKKIIKMSKKDGYVRFKDNEREIKSPFMITRIYQRIKERKILKSLMNKY